MSQSDNLPQLPQVQPPQDDDDDTQSANSAVHDQNSPQGKPQQIYSAGSSTHDGLALPDVAGDVDLIEKEWVEKAKAIVDSTVGDPRSQTDQINKMKAEYIRKRYGKDVKT